MPRGVLQGEPETLGRPPWERLPGEACLVIARDPDSNEAVPAAMRWGLPLSGTRSQRRLVFGVEQLTTRRVARLPRCLVPLEGYVQPGVRRSRIGVEMAAEFSLGAAAVWEDGPGGAGFALVTTEANELLAAAHARMPVLLPAGVWPMWLAASPPGPAELALLRRPAPADWLRARALPKQALRQPVQPVARQLEAWAPGSRLWTPRQGRAAA
jgi:putative SOS response-associated peptidase YedK